MPKVKNPITVTEHFKLRADTAPKLGFLDGTLAKDTRLFIDPLLLAGSRHQEMQQAATAYRKRFESIIRLLAASTAPGDVPWRGATKLMDFHEVRATCLGYGAAGIDGNGFGPAMISRVAKTGKQIVDLGVRDPDMFALLALFEEGVGADLISDMTTSIILENLVAFTQRIAKSLRIPLESHLLGRNTVLVPTNPFGSKPVPFLFVPDDVLRPLPIATDREEICDAAMKNQALRDKVNAHISSIWTLKTSRDKRKLRQQILANAQAFNTLLTAYRTVEARPYDVFNDPDGHYTWAREALQAAAENPISIPNAREIDPAKLVATIVDQFRFLVEKRGLWRNLYSGKVPHHEHYSQNLFFAVAHSYCKANNLDLSPEVDTGSGRIDFKFSRGFAVKVIVEIKLSRNSKLVAGYVSQIARYNDAEETEGGFYIVIDVGGMRNKDKELTEAKNKAVREQAKPTQLVFVDGLEKLTASKL